LLTQKITIALIAGLMATVISLTGCMERQVYPENIAKDPIFSDMKKAINTAGYYIQVIEPLDAQKISILRKNGVRELYNTSEDNIYYGLIEESNLTKVENLKFVREVYLPKTR